MTNKQKFQALLPLIKLASEAAARLPTAERADIYEGMAIAIGTLDARLQKQAWRACRSLRDSETHQLTFVALLNESTPEAKAQK